VRIRYAHGKPTVESWSTGFVAESSFRAFTGSTGFVIKQSRKLEVQDLLATQKLRQGEKAFTLEMAPVDNQKENKNDSK
jgi:hypothetical protein